MRGAISHLTQSHVGVGHYSPVDYLPLTGPRGVRGGFSRVRRPIGMGELALERAGVEVRLAQGRGARSTNVAGRAGAEGVQATVVEPHLDALRGEALDDRRGSARRPPPSSR